MPEPAASPVPSTPPSGASTQPPSDREQSSRKMVHVGVRCGVTQGAAHRDDLAFVMKSMGQDVMQDECGRADRDISVGEMELLIRVELLIGEGGKIRLGLLNDL